MSEQSAKREYERATALRQATFELLEQHMEHGGHAHDPEVITCLQDAANLLGTVEQSLKKLADSPNGQHPVASEQPAAGSNGASPKLPLSSDAAITLALAETLVPLTPSRADQAERWLRIMRKHGFVGKTLEALGMPSREFSTPAVEPRQPGSNREDSVTAVADDATRFARDRCAPAVSTVDVLFAVILHYGRLFDRALYGATSKTRDDLLTALKQVEPVTQ